SQSILQRIAGLPQHSDYSPILLSRTQAGIDDLLCCQRLVAPVRFELAGQDNLSELPDHVRLLRVLGAAAVLLHGEPARMAFHVEIAAANSQGGRVDLETHLGPEERNHEVRELKVSLSSTHNSPLLIGGLERAIERRTRSPRKEQFAGKTDRHRKSALS